MARDGEETNQRGGTSPGKRCLLNEVSEWRKLLTNLNLRF
jgi:hypothetical protein